MRGALFSRRAGQAFHAPAHRPVLRGMFRRNGRRDAPRTHVFLRANSDRSPIAWRIPMPKTIVEPHSPAWFALADAEHCRLLCCRLTKQGKQHVDEYGSFENTLPEAEHARPMTGDGMTHDIEEEERRFGGQIVEWLRKRAEEHEIDHLVIFAPPRMLGVLRKASAGLLKGHLDELEGDLMRLEAGQLAEHPMVRGLVPATHE